MERDDVVLLYSFSDHVTFEKIGGRQTQSIQAQVDWANQREAEVKPWAMDAAS